MATTVLADRYELGDKLGSGGMATVYEAHDALLDRAVAIKLLRSEALAEATARQRFAAEARAAASLSHPHAVAVYDVSSGTGQPFIVMELVRGRTLQDVLEDGRPDDAQVVAVGSQVLAALHAAHRRGLVHRDVKPANILLPGGVLPRRPEELPGVKLADFGIAKATADATVGLTMAGQVIGTPKYLSPEQVKGERATPRSDLYATAVVLYEMFAGRPPFAQDSAVALALAHREDDPPPLADLRPDLNRDLVALVHAGLSKDPDQRLADANDMREALIAAAAGRRSGTLLLDHGAGTQALAGPTTPVERPARDSAPPPAPPRRSRRIGVLVAALVLVGVLGLLASQLLDGSDTPSDEPSAQTTEQAPAGGDEQDDDGADAEQGGDSGQDDSQQPDDEAPGAVPPATEEEAPAGDGGGAGEEEPAPDDEEPADPGSPPEGEPPASE